MIDKVFDMNLSVGREEPLAHLCAFDLGYSGLNKRPDGQEVPITAYTYCSPRVGDEEFKKAMDEMNIKVGPIRDQSSCIAQLQNCQLLASKSC